MINIDLDDELEDEKLEKDANNDFFSAASKENERFELEEDDNGKNYLEVKSKDGDVSHLVRANVDGDINDLEVVDIDTMDVIGNIKKVSDVFRLIDPKNKDNKHTFKETLDGFKKDQRSIDLKLTHSMYLDKKKKKWFYNISQDKTKVFGALIGKEIDRGKIRLANKEFWSKREDNIDQKDEKQRLKRDANTIKLNETDESLGDVMTEARIEIKTRKNESKDGKTTANKEILELRKLLVLECKNLLKILEEKGLNIGFYKEENGQFSLDITTATGELVFDSVLGGDPLKIADALKAVSAITKSSLAEKIPKDESFTKDDEITTATESQKDVKEPDKSILALLNDESERWYTQLLTDLAEGQKNDHQAYDAFLEKMRNKTLDELRDKDSLVILITNLIDESLKKEGYFGQDESLIIPDSKELIYNCPFVESRKRGNMLLQEILG
jgi:hypothetical protein